MIKNLDLQLKTKDELLSNLAESVKNNDTNAMKESLENWQNYVADEIMSKVEEISQATDRAILSGRGIRQLTTEEVKFYDNFIKSAKQQGVIEGVTSVLPETVYTAVLDDIKTSHPLLNVIDFQNTAAAVKWVINKQTGQMATWDELNTPITKELSGIIEVVDMTLMKLTAYMFVTKDMLNLGPVWVDAYVRQTLSEALATALEVAIVDGDGVKKPIGMTRNFKGAYQDSTGYSRKDTVALTSLDQVEYNAIISELAEDENGNSRGISEVLMLVNPKDYFSKILPATSFLTPNGTYATNVFPFPTKVIQSVGVPAGKVVIGIGKNYFMGAGTSKGGKLEYDDSYKFIEDLRTYTIRFYGNGRPKDINSFILADISNLTSTYATFKTVSDTE